MLTTMVVIPVTLTMFCVASPSSSVELESDGGEDAGVKVLWRRCGGQCIVSTDGVQEIYLRFTVEARGEVFAKYILRRTDAELAILEGGTVIVKGKQSEKLLCTINSVMEMAIEYVAILTTPRRYSTRITDW